MIIVRWQWYSKLFQATELPCALKILRVSIFFRFVPRLTKCLFEVQIYKGTFLSHFGSSLFKSSE